MTDGKASILIVDDRPEKLLALEAVLEDLNQHIVRAYSGREALRHVLEREFAVILLDVNMPGMDGFETAALIRQRRSSQHTPIIFITAFGDEMHASRGYSLGAVDYILAPVLPEVLRTKVAVFVDLFRKTEQTKRQSESLRRRATQLQKLAAASVTINSALSTDQMLQTVTDTARDIVGAHQAITLFLVSPRGGARPPRTLNVTSFSDKYAAWRGRRLQLDAIATTVVAQSRAATRLTARELRDHPDWDVVNQAEVPPIGGGMLAAPLTGRDGTNLGVVYLADRYEDEFTNDDEAIVVQLAQMTSIAIENSLYAEEREANRLKDEFLATLSHELRTPLNAILGWTQLLRMDGADPAEVGHGLEVIERNARSQTKLIEDLLDVSRITTGKLRLNMRPAPLGPVVLAAVDAVRPGVEARGVRVECHLDGTAAQAPVAGDPDRLQQVFWNLLTNAAKFTPAGGLVEVRLEPHGHAAVRLGVRDNGAGIDPKFLPHVFDRFRQADSSSTRSHGGLGIGLTIVRHIVELHGGSVAADSAGEGHGATFTVTLPVATTPAVAAGAAAPGSAEGGAATAPLPADAAGSPPAPTAASASAAGGAPRRAAAPAAGAGEARTSLGGLRVLLIDDEPDAREVVSEILRRCGGNVTTAASAREGLVAVRAGGVDVLISDIAMPDEDGYWFIRALRSLPAEEGGQLPAIALTAYAREEDRQRALDAGFQNHVAKPVEPNHLAQALARLAPPPAPAGVAVGSGATAGENGNGASH
jgi:signal transduction histidine kinase/DNA-binding response OmpR family regulator